MRRALLVALVLVAAAGAAAANGPNPITQPPLDGCARDPTAFAQGLVSPFVYVNRSSEPQWLTGVADAVIPGDDLDIRVEPDPASSFLLAAGASRLLAARDSAAAPAFAWPEPGDRVQLLGSWVWNCTKWKPAGERTELHPFRALWVQRAVSARSPWGEAEGDVFVSTDSTAAGAVADCALQAAGDQTAFVACVATEPLWQDVTATYRFLLPAPPRPPGAGKLYARVVDQGSVGAAVANVTLKAGAAVVTMRLASPPGVRVVSAKQVFLGWRKVPATELPQHLRISLRSPVDSSICDAAGVWGPCPVSGATDVYLPRGTPWRLAVYAPSGTITHRFASPVASLGLHRDRARGYALSYVVIRVNDALKRAAAQPR